MRARVSIRRCGFGTVTNTSLLEGRKVGPRGPFNDAGTNGI